MGLNLCLLRQILKLYQSEGVPKRVLTLGRQAISATPAETLTMVQESGLALQAGTDTLEVVQEQSLGSMAGYVSDRSFFRLLGIELHSLDASAFEKPDLIHDLNEPVPTEWQGCYDQILDGGTLEHVFDIRQALLNIFSLLATGGQVIHMVPCNNYVNHGFYQFSPTLFYDFYLENKFQDIQGHLLKHIYDYDLNASMLAYPINFQNLREIRSWHMMMLFVKARKGVNSSGNLIPQQAKWSHIYADKPPIRSRARYLPRSIRTWLRNLRTKVYRSFPWFLPNRREPWGHGSPELWK